MSPVVALAVALAAGAAAVAGVTLVGALDPGRRRVLTNLNRGVIGLPVPEEEQEPEHEAVLLRFTRAVTPGLVRRVLDRQHVLAGRPAAWPMDRLLVIKMLWVPVGALLAALVLSASPSPLLSFVWVLATIAVYFLPELLLNSTGVKRNEQIETALADTLDQMTIAVEAGLGFDSAMARAAHNGRGALAEELTRTLQDIQMGRSRRQAFEALTTRTTVTDLRRFVRAVIQADAYGISIADVLRTQADEMRLKRRQRAEEKAQKLPVKVLAPLMLCILPVLFIVVMGPAVMSMVEAFGNM